MVEKKLITLDEEKINVIDTREVSEMMETPHADILKKLEGTVKPDGTVKQIGIIPTLTEGKIPLSDYFIESTYKDGSGKENKCYLCTKLGCDFLANKFTGKKGILFTAKYVKKFSEMEKHIEKSLLSFQIENPIERALAWIKEKQDAEKILTEKNQIIEELSPLAKLARERIDKTGTVSITDITKTYALKRGQLTNWAKINGYIHKRLTEVNKLGEDFFKVVGTEFKGIAVKEEGIKLVDSNIDEIKTTLARLSKAS